YNHLMAQGHAAVEITPGSLQLFKDANAARYKELEIANNQANEILAQVGLLLKDDRPDGPLEGLGVRKMILSGSSASAAAVVNYLPAHMIYRAHEMKPIFDGFLPTSNGGNNPIMKVDVPVVHMPTMTEVVAGAANGNRYRRPDGDAAGDQFRIYEVAGMAHIDSRYTPIYSPNPCKHPVSLFPHGMGLAAGLERLIQWVDKGKAPPRAEYITVDNNTADGSVLALDANGNAKGGVRNPYVDVPAFRYVAPNEPASPPIANPSPVVSGQGPGGAQLFCGIAGYQVPLSAEQMKALYKNKKDYENKVTQRTNALIKDGWISAAYKDLILADAAKVEFR
ncbi:MAG TPA: alpha/beta hydrolase domain-containing protein, partial [Terriglobia bacterium]|nr:alpha/beta hydrolase domain-containing protein [Terriglobia bacterium]